MNSGERLSLSSSGGTEFKTSLKTLSAFGADSALFWDTTEICGDSVLAFPKTFSTFQGGSIKLFSHSDETSNFVPIQCSVGEAGRDLSVG